MRRVSIVLAGCLLAALAAASVAEAAPTVRFKAVPVPIKGFPHTGNILGAGAAVQAEYKISGTEYGGFPPPLIGVNFYLPKGTVLHTSGFPTCALTMLEQVGPSGCSRASAAGPVGKVLGIVSFGSERVEEPATLESFYAPGGGIEFFTNGHSPVSLEILSKGHYVHLGGAGGLRPRADRRGAARLDRPRSAVRVGRVDQRQGRLGPQGARQAGLLRPRAQEVPQGRLPDQDRTDLRRRRGRAAGARRW